MSRSEAFIRVECDRCGKEAIELTLEQQPEARGPDVWLLFGGEEGRLRNHGWTKDGEDDLGPECSLERAQSLARRAV
jgi:hypothetical protein